MNAFSLKGISVWHSLTSRSYCYRQAMFDKQLPLANGNYTYYLLELCCSIPDLRD